MGFMTGQAALFHWIMFIFDLGKLLSHFFVTLEAELIAGLEKVVFVACRVGIMAFHAIPILNNLMGADGCGGDHSAMTTEAYFCGITFQELPMGGSMGIMTSCAIPLL
jgi:hypothetical protein